MANLIIKPASNGSLVLQDEGGTAAHTIDASGNHTLANNTTLSGTANALGTVTSGNISNNAIVYPAGHVIQVVENKSATQISVTTDTFSTSAGLMCNGTITPKFASSNILLMAHFNVYCHSGSQYLYTDFYKNASDFTATGNLSGLSGGLTVTSTAPSWCTTSCNFLDTCSENSTSQKTYKISGRRHAASGTSYLGWGTNVYNVLIMMEIAA